MEKCIGAGRRKSSQVQAETAAAETGPSYSNRVSLTRSLRACGLDLRHCTRMGL